MWGRTGTLALIKYVNRFDSPDLSINSIKVSREEINAALKKVDRPFIRSLNRAISQIKAFHTQQLSKSWINLDRPGAIVGQMVNPVGAVGVYVPGGKGGNTPLVSSVLMGAIPAKIAGVSHISMKTPIFFKNCKLFKDWSLTQIWATILQISFSL